MGNCLQSSVLWRVMQTIGHALAACASDSRIFAAIGRTWHGSRFRKWLLERLDAPTSSTDNAAYTRICKRLNDSCAKCHAPKDWWNASVCGRLWHGLVSALQKSRIIGWLFADGMQGLLLYAVGAYVLIDWLLRDALAVPIVSSVWDELLLIFSVFWLIWRRIGRKTPLDVRTNPLDLPILLFLAVGFFLMCIVSPYASIQISGYRATVQYLLWFFVLTRLFESDRDFKRLYLTLCAVALVLSLHGIYQYIIGVPMPKNWVAAAETAVRTRVFSI
ncbi:MAG: hypothetical protein IIV87_03250, partial [Oscillospiraceae bacterium]|nr:hypothetical protein [Oscillospiraceae bacterium]